MHRLLEQLGFDMDRHQHRMHSSGGKAWIENLRRFHLCDRIANDGIEPRFAINQDAFVCADALQMSLPGRENRPKRDCIS